MCWTPRCHPRHEPEIFEFVCAHPAFLAGCTIHTATPASRPTDEHRSCATPASGHRAASRPTLRKRNVDHEIARARIRLSPCGLMSPVEERISGGRVVRESATALNTEDKHAAVGCVSRAASMCDASHIRGRACEAHAEFLVLPLVQIRRRVGPTFGDVLVERRHQPSGPPGRPDPRTPTLGRSSKTRGRPATDARRRGTTLRSCHQRVSHRAPTQISGEHPMTTRPRCRSATTTSAPKTSIIDPPAKQGACRAPRAGRARLIAFARTLTPAEWERASRRTAARSASSSTTSRACTRSRSSSPSPSRLAARSRGSPGTRPCPQRPAREGQRRGHGGGGDRTAARETPRPRPPRCAH